MILIPVLFIIGALSFIYIRQYREKALNEVPAMLQTLCAKTEEALDSTKHIAVMIDNQPTVKLSVTRLMNQKGMFPIDTTNNNLISFIIKTPNDINPNIDSVYLYVRNESDMFLSSRSGLCSLKHAPDINWFYTYADRNSKTPYVVKRDLQYFHFQSASNEILSVFHPIIGGVVVTNFEMSYYESILNSSQLFENETLAVLDPAGNPLIYNSGGDITLAQETLPVRWDEIKASDGEFFTESSNYFLHSYTTGKDGLTYVSLLPKKGMLSFIDHDLILVLLIVISISFCLSFFPTYIAVKHNFSHLERIINIFSEAENGKYIRAPLNIKADEYTLILDNIIQMFAKQSVLTAQCSQHVYEKKLAELSALQFQINPHFLFNTLQIVDFEMKHAYGIHNPIGKILEELSELLKYSFQRTSDAPLREELYYAKLYCSIQKFHFENKFIVYWECSDDCLSASFCRMLLQPLIENSLFHGICSKEDRGFIKVKIFRRNDRLLVSVIDNGEGIAPDRLRQIRALLEQDKLPTAAGSVGLTNSNYRLKLKYGAESQIKIYSKPNRGTAIHFSIPYIPWEEP